MTTHLARCKTPATAVLCYTLRHAMHLDARTLYHHCALGWHEQFQGDDKEGRVSMVVACSWPCQL